MTDIRIEALAEAWASVEGRLAAFSAGRESQGDAYKELTAQTAEMLRRLEARGFTLVARNALASARAEGFRQGIGEAVAEAETLARLVRDRVDTSEKCRIAHDAAMDIRDAIAAKARDLV